jgi:hypothetical protein
MTTASFRPVSASGSNVASGVSGVVAGPGPGGSGVATGGGSGVATVPPLPQALNSGVINANTNKRQRILRAIK